MSNVSTCIEESGRTVARKPLSTENIRSAIAAYWEDPNTRSIIDGNLHRLEIEAVRSYLQKKDRLADIGCGNGIGTVQYAKRVAHCLGVERSGHLRQQALENVRREGCENVTLQEGDILDLGLPAASFDAVVTQRCLINLPSWTDQQNALMQIGRLLKPGGRYIMVENTSDAFMALNRMRVQAGLEPIAQHWHNRFFDYDQLTEWMQGRFQLLDYQDFSFYYFLTRVYVPMFAEFSGFGIHAKKDPIFEHSDAAALRLFNLFSNSIAFKNTRSISPIQVYVWRWEGGFK